VKWWGVAGSATKPLDFTSDNGDPTEEDPAEDVKNEFKIDEQEW
jgi:hypothetical protein